MVLGTPLRTPTPGKLRRTKSVETVEDLSVQRLVEYFTVISCEPRWKSPDESQQKAADIPKDEPNITSIPPSTGSEVSDVSDAMGMSTPPRTTTAKQPTTDFSKSIQASAKKLSKSMGNTFRRKEVSGSIHAINASRSMDTQDSEGREEEQVLPPPKPRGKWSKEKEAVQAGQERTDGNIHMYPDQDTPKDDFNFQPKITARYPLEDHKDNPLNPMITQFCFPHGEFVEPTKQFHMPHVSHFVLTNDKGRKVYGTCLTFHEEYRPSASDPWNQSSLVQSESMGGNIEISVDTQQEKAPLYIPKCLCILSIWPYVKAFREYLSQLYRIATSTNIMAAPIERYVVNLCMEIPAPPPGAFEVRVNILDSAIRFWAPPAKLPIAYVALPYQILFDCLDIENILHLWYCLAMERKVLLVSSQYSILTMCAEILSSLLFPMHWSHLYVPMLPRFLCPMLDAPVPYLCGVTRDNWMYAQQFLSEETIVVDLDRNSLLFGEGTPSLPPLPGKKWSKLQSTLESIAGHLFWKTRGLEEEYQQVASKKLSYWKFKQMCRDKAEARWKEKLNTYDHAYNLQFTPDSENLGNDDAFEKDQSQWDSVQESFLRFFVAVFKDYRQFLVMPDKDSPMSPPPGSSEWMNWSLRRSFNREDFVKSQKPEYATFLTEICLTQQFDAFMTKRLYEPGLPDVLFFDQSIDAKLNRSRLKLRKVETPFLQSAKTHKTLKKFQAIEPNVSGLPENYQNEDGKAIMYKNWPKTFDETLFLEPRPIPKIITAEFDRQAALVSRLRAMSPLKEHEDSLLLGDYDVSEVGMSFTVFFFAYSAVIGREWEQFQRKRRELKMEAVNLDETDFVKVNPEPMTPVSKAITTPAVTTPFLSDPEDGIDEDAPFSVWDPCPNGVSAVDNAVVYVSASPCPQNYLDDINTQAQQAYDVISKFALSPTNDRGASLLDEDEGVAEFEEARDVANAQLDLAMDTLQIMQARDVATNSDLFKSLMEACGRCGDTKRALALIDTMKRDGLAPDREVLICFMEAFAHNEGNASKQSPNKQQYTRKRGSDAYTTYLKKKFDSVAGESTSSTTILSSSDEEGSDFMSDTASECSSNLSGGRDISMQQTISNSMIGWFTPHKKQRPKRRRRKKKRKSKKKLPITDHLEKQIALGENLLEFLYPDLSIDLSGDACPQCSKAMNEEDVIAGWKPCEFQDFTTSCPHCEHRFVPRFSVSSSSPTFMGSQGPGTPLYCEFLSPWVLRKELHPLIAGPNGAQLMLDPDWRGQGDIKATLWWNLITTCKRNDLPFTFLLQGSFQNRLINPVPAG